MLAEQPGALTILVDRMSGLESERVLLQDLEPGAVPADVLEKLLAEIGGWPLLLRLVNRLIVRAARIGVGRR
ncbi:hypothetical protein OHV05_35685 (plasmid) [Kitasatospora sp. NBC_00070]|uniref:hypothetical protein n=1 Tax=Kitasatospora sp. NBC_00070 TaxID=2975962 RepID=UPI002F9198F3